MDISTGGMDKIWQETVERSVIGLMKSCLVHFIFIYLFRFYLLVSERECVCMSRWKGRGTSRIPSGRGAQHGT